MRHKGSADIGKKEQGLLGQVHSKAYKDTMYTLKQPCWQ